MSLLAQALIFLAAAVIAVPLSKRLGLGSVLGYLAAGIVIGPWGFKLVTDVEGIQHFAEFGVVLLLFVIGLELQPSRLWELRKSVFGLGGLQVLITGIVLAGVAMLFGMRFGAAVVAGFGLSLSSTAFALQLLAEKNQLATDHGRASFGILLFQDLAVIPLLALLPVLGEAHVDANAAQTPLWLSVLKVIGVLGAVFVGGRYVIRPVFRIVAKAHSQELFTATALLIVIGTALLVDKVGLSMSLGAFLAGVMLADSEYRHELEADIEPFKGLLLGLFFISVGMSVHIGLLIEKPLIVVALVLGMTLIKAVLLFGIGKWTFKNNESALNLAIVISQGGEFAFVLYKYAVDFKIMADPTRDMLVVVVSLSMAVTPLLVLLHEKVIKPRFFSKKIARDFDVAAEEDTPVIIAGFGRVGQVVGRMLNAKKIPFTAMDASPEHIDFIKKFGNKVFYGDAARLDLLRAARAEKAKIFVLAVDDVEASLKIAENVQQHFPHLTIFARARNRQHAYKLMALGIRHVMRETFLSSLEMTGDILEELGLTWTEARNAMERFRQVDEQLLEQNYKFAGDQKELQARAVASRAELEKIFDTDANKKKSA